MEVKRDFTYRTWTRAIYDTTKRICNFREEALGMQTQAESLWAETGPCIKKFDSHDLAQLHSKLGKSLAVSTQKERI